jgi:hypothetical protein
MDCSKCVGKPEEKRPIGKPTRGWEENIRTSFKEIMWEDADCIDPTQDRARWRALMNTVINVRFP